MAQEALRDNDFSINDQWQQICGQLKLEFGETAFESWLKPLSVGSLNDGTINMCVPTSFIKNWVIAHYSDRIHKIWEHKNPEIKKIQFVVQNVAGGPVNSLLKGDTSLLKKIKSTPTPQSIYGFNGVANSYGDDKYITSQLNPAYTFENFVVGKTNEFAYAAAKKVAEALIADLTANKLFAK